MGSVGRETPKFVSKLWKFTASGVKKVMSKSSLSSAKIYIKITTAARGNNSDQ